MRNTEKRRLAYLFLPVCLILLGTTQCQVGQTGSPDYVTNVSVEDANGQTASSFGAGQQIQFSVSIRNRSNFTQTLSFPTAQIYDFYIVRAGTTNIVWQWSANRSFIQTTTSLNFFAGQTRTYTVTWDQVDNSGQAVPAGDYEVQGRIVTSDDIAPVNDFSSSQFRSTLSLFTIQP